VIARASGLLRHRPGSATFCLATIHPLAAHAQWPPTRYGARPCSAGTRPRPDDRRRAIRVQWCSAAMRDGSRVAWRDYTRRTKAWKRVLARSPRPPSPPIRNGKWTLYGYYERKRTAADRQLSILEGHALSTMFTGRTLSYWGGSAHGAWPHLRPGQRCRNEPRWHLELARGQTAQNPPPVRSVCASVCQARSPWDIMAELPMSL
jgi:hypothetical protein